MELNQVREELEESVKNQEFQRAAELKEALHKLEMERSTLLASAQPSVEEVRTEKVGLAQPSLEEVRIEKVGLAQPSVEVETRGGSCSTLCGGGDKRWVLLNPLWRWRQKMDSPCVSLSPFVLG